MAPKQYKVVLSEKQIHLIHDLVVDSVEHCNYNTPSTNRVNALSWALIQQTGIPRHERSTLEKRRAQP